MRRRQFIAGLGGAAALSIVAAAQDRVRRIGVLMGYAESDREGQAFIGAFREEFAKLGWAEGRNVTIDYRWTVPENAEAVQRFASEIIASQPDVILTQNTPNTAALSRLTRTIPIVFATASDPVGSGFVAGYARPGGNVTGFTVNEPELAGKWLELLRELAPRTRRVALLFNPATAPYYEYYLKPFKAAAASFGVEGIAAPVRDRSEFEPVIAAQAREPDSGLVGIPDSFLNVNRAEIASLMARHRVPAVYPFRFFAEIGGLATYGNDFLDNFRRAAAYVDRILKGAKPTELPVQAAVKFDLVINLKTARALGLDVPMHLQQRASAVIE